MLRDAVRNPPASAVGRFNAISVGVSVGVGVGCSIGVAVGLAVGVAVGYNFSVGVGIGTGIGLGIGLVSLLFIWTLIRVERMGKDSKKPIKL